MISLSRGKFYYFPFTYSNQGKIKYHNRMNDSKAILARYQQAYADISFERGGLFKFILQQYHPQEALYPGCSIHLTPAFYFPHVIFIDQDPQAMHFFSNQETVNDLVNRRRVYRRRPHIQFIFQDFTRPLPLIENQFDLLLALYTHGVAQACKSYLKMGGYYLSNNHQHDAEEAFQDDALALSAVVQKHQGKYRGVDFDPLHPFEVSKRASQSKRYLRQTSQGVEYIENESYYIFRRVK